jgi:hypothetical protein
VTPMMCAPSEEEALARGLEGANFFGYSLAHYYVFGDHVPATTDVWREFLERRGKMGYSPEAALAERGTRCWVPRRQRATTPGCEARSAPRLSSANSSDGTKAGVDQLIFVMQAGHNRHEHIMESIELFGTEVLPEFIERDEEAGRAKAARLEPVVAQALARGTATIRPCLPTTRCGPSPSRWSRPWPMSPPSSGSSRWPTSRPPESTTRSSSAWSTADPPILGPPIRAPPAGRMHAGSG